MGWYLVGSTSWLLQLLEATEAELQGHRAWPLRLRDPRALGGQALAAGSWGRDGRGGGGVQPDGRRGEPVLLCYLYFFE